MAGGDHQSSLRSEQMTVIVNNQDVTGLELKLIAAASISGTVVLEGSVPTDLPANLSLQVETGGQTSERETYSVPVGLDKQFKIMGLDAGMVKFLSINQEAMSDWFVKAIEYHGTVAAKTLSLQKSEQATGVVVRLAHGFGSIAGRVVIPEHFLPAGSSIQVAVLPSGENKTSFPLVPVKPDGTFEVSGLLPGIYDLRLIPTKVPENLANVFWRVRETVIVNQHSETPITITLTAERK